MSEYEVHWQMDFPLINSWAHLERLFFEVVCTIYKNSKQA